MRLRQLFTDRAVNGLLLLTIAALAFTGIVSLFANADYTAFLFEAHRIGGAALLILLIPKTGIIIRSLRRRWHQRATTEWIGVGVSLIVLLLTLGTIGAALGWSLARGPWAGEWGLPLIVVHWYLGLVLIPLVIGHVALRWRNPNRVPGRRDFAGRRRSVGLAVAALVALGTWRGLNVGAGATQARTSQRRFTGSREFDDGTPNGFFVTAFISDDPAPIDLAAWRLRVNGRVGHPLELDHSALRHDATTVATIDCTGGIYATRAWSGLALGPLLDAAAPDPDATTVWFISTTGHRWPLPLAEARRSLLATRVNGEILSHAHGFPLRLIAPERRGFQWIKWLTTIEIA
ncbi:MAG TPA: molybdopterin-dependent oxidoreductase [Thermomicrobiales bacterium]|jgi:cytochrome b561